MSMVVMDRLRQFKEEIIQAYLNGDGYERICKKYNCSESHFHKFLRLESDVLPHSSRQVRKWERKVLELHKNGLTSGKISKLLKISDDTAKRILNKNGINTKYRDSIRKDLSFEHKQEIIDLYNSGLGAHLIARKFDCDSSSIVKRLKNWGVVMRPLRKFHMNENFFENISTEHQAYSLGFFLADGCNTPKGCRVSITITDEDILRDIAKAMEFEKPIKVFPPQGLGKKTQYQIRVISRKMSNDLIKLGCGHLKTYNAVIPKIPEHLYRHFGLGLIDGDGCMTGKNRSWRVNITGTEMVCRGFSEIVKRQLGFSGQIRFVKKCKNNNNSGIFNFGVCAQHEILAMYHWLYDDATIFLKRKHLKFLEFLENLKSSPKSYLEAVEKYSELRGTYNLPAYSPRLFTNKQESMILAG